MNYHDIKHDDMLNGDGLRVTLFVSGCSHDCPGCHNPETHPLDSGIPFDDDAMHELLAELDKPYISGVTISGGDPMHPDNVGCVEGIVDTVRNRYQNRKNIWVYTGYSIEDLLLDDKYIGILRKIDVLVDGKFEASLQDVNAPWVGSTNQRVIRLGKVRCL